jgi:large subunit ribosomal protein L20
MPRVTCGFTSHRRKKRLLKRAKGFIGGRHRLFRSARDTIQRGGIYAFRDRKAKKRLYRNMWVVRIAAALLPYGITYSQFIGAIHKAKIDINRKMMAEMALYDGKGFENLVEIAKKNLPKPATKPAT